MKLDGKDVVMIPFNKEELENYIGLLRLLKSSQAYDEDDDKAFETNARIEQVEDYLECFS